MTAKEVGARISDLRTASGMTQIQLAEKLSVTNKAVSKWETGEGFPDITTLPLLALELGVSVDEILCGKPQVNADAPEPESRRIKIFIVAETILSALLMLLWMPGAPPSLGVLIDWASLIVLIVAALGVSYIFKLRKRESGFSQILILYGIPVACAIAVTINVGTVIYRGYPLGILLNFATIPILYAAIVSFLIYQASRIKTLHIANKAASIRH